MTTYYIKSSGNDANTGLSDAQAWQTIAKVNSAQAAMSDGDQILFRKGDVFNEALVISHSNITFGAYGTGTKSTISGFTTITDWIPEGSGVYSKVINPASKLNMLTIDGVQYAMSKYPYTGFRTFESASTNVSITDDQLTETPGWVGAEVCIFKDNYHLDRCIVDSQSGGTLNYTSLGSTFNARTDNRAEYFFQNDVRILALNNIFGEWAYNSTTKKLSVYFGYDPSGLTVKVATIDNLITNESFDYVTFYDLFFEGSNSSSILFSTGTDNCSFTTCAFKFSGHNALNLSGGSPLIFNCTFDHVNGGNVLNGASAIFNSNVLTNMGAIPGQANKMVDAIALTCNGNNPVVQNNTIRNTGYMGIYFTVGAATGEIRNNFIDAPCQVCFDSGGIYLGHDHPGTIIDKNIVINSGGNGIYMDEYCTGVTASNNVCSHNATSGIYVHKGSGNTIVNNTCYDNLYGIKFSNGYITEDDLPHDIVANNLNNNIVTGNFFIAKTASQFALMYITRYPGYVASFATWTLSNNCYARPIDDNLTIKTDLPSAGVGSKTLAQWKTLTSKDTNSLQSPKAITTEADLYFSYNETNAAKQVSNPTTAIDMNGVEYSTVFELQPYTGKVLIKDLTAGNPSGANTLLIAPNGKFYKNAVTGKFFVKQQ